MLISLMHTELHQTNNVYYHQHEDATVNPVWLSWKTLERSQLCDYCFTVLKYSININTSLYIIYEFQ